jgi:hypothetical protein
MSESVETRRAARPVCRPTGAAANSVPQTGYQGGQAASSRKHLEHAGEVLLLLSFLPLGKTTRMGLTALFEQRLRRAYEGVSR